MSEFYVTDSADPEAPRVLTEFTSPYHGTIRPGDRVVYDNPSFPLPLPELTTVTELIDFGDGPVQAILTGPSGTTYEVSAINLRPAAPTGEAGDGR